MAEEPAENISGGAGGGGRVEAFPDGEPKTRAEAAVDELGDMYWEKAYGGQAAFECLVRTILSQNTSDKASQPAFDELIARYGPERDPEDGNPERVDLARALADAERSELAETISSAGLYNQKSKVIGEAAEWALDSYGSAASFDEYVTQGEPVDVRETLLSIRGVGPKTADCVLLFSGGQDGVFPVDTHVHRIARRMGLAPPDADHEEVREHLEATIPGEKCGFGHTSMIQFGREYCTAREPACLEGPEACPLYDQCDRVGIDELDGEAVDPADTVEP
ncbi:endonuclease III [Halalkaliarchaeum sp. AArc-GB]|uniref:endonuclease III domain-containing protein n=1 Tax=Halalkaliarchaeum sp. AArc-GB TaxID=3074078 RepID=UPI00285693ED|nr:endonuclease III [Halalkaliarchaeum sp. AArc-GB]MDR5671867.1 endonuclease III [Halalkaliarchaeum sp. AArc-GB]